MSFELEAYLLGNYRRRPKELAYKENELYYFQTLFDFLSTSGKYDKVKKQNCLISRGGIS